MTVARLHHADSAAVDALYRSYQPVFVLTTGRSGSRFVAELLGWSPRLAAHHEPRPTLQRFADFARTRQGDLETLTRMIDAARMESVLEAMVQDRIYVESNQCLTYFGPAIARLFEGSRFVHLVRHPGDFVASAVRKGWHLNDSIWEAGRVRMDDATAWAGLTQTQKLAWLWREVNEYLDGFLAGLPPARARRFRLEDLVSHRESVDALFTFCGADPPPAEVVRQAQARRVNQLEVGPDEPPTMRKRPDFPGYRAWPETTKGELRGLVAAVADRYAYGL